MGYSVKPVPERASSRDLILFGLIRSKLASTLIFDMHDEYAEGDPKKPEIPGLRTLFGSQDIKVFDLDDRPGGNHPQIQIGLNQIEPGDISLLSDELDLTDTFEATSYALSRKFREKWLSVLLDEERDPAELAEDIGAHQGALEALIRKLRYLRSRPYIVDHSTSDPVRSISGAPAFGAARRRSVRPAVAIARLHAGREHHDTAHSQPLYRSGRERA